MDDWASDVYILRGTFFSLWLILYSTPACLYSMRLSHRRYHLASIMRKMLYIYKSKTHMNIDSMKKALWIQWKSVELSTKKLICISRSDRPSMGYMNKCVFQNACKMTVSSIAQTQRYTPTPLWCYGGGFMFYGGPIFFLPTELMRKLRYLK